MQNGGIRLRFANVEGQRGRSTETYGGTSILGRAAIGLSQGGGGQRLGRAARVGPILHGPVVTQVIPVGVGVRATFTASVWAIVALDEQGR